MKNRLTLLTVYFIVFLNALGYFLILPSLIEGLSNPTYGLISPALMQHFGDYFFAIILGVGSLAGVMAAPFLGRLSDHIGRRKTLIFCTILTLISVLLPMLGFIKSSLSLFLLGNIVNAIASNNQPIAQAVISDVSPRGERRAYRLSLDTLVVCIAMTLGPLLATSFHKYFASVQWNLAMPFIIAALLTLVALGLALYVLPETLTQPPGLRLSLRHAFSLSSVTDTLRLSRSVKRFLFIFVLAQTGWAGFFQYLYVYLSFHLHWSDTTLSWYMSSLGLYLGLSLALLYPVLLRACTLMQGVCFCLGLSTVSLGLMALFPNAFSLWALAPFLAAGIGMYFPSLITLFSQEIPATEQGWIMAVSMSCIGIAWCLTGFTSVYLSRFSPTLPILASALFLGASWLLSVLSSSRTRGPSPIIFRK
jgi:DHA1 family tetracycline resistance protein-like MFS transporter